MATQRIERGFGVGQFSRQPVVIDKKIDSLPFRDMPWDDFERLVWELVQAVECTVRLLAQSASHQPARSNAANRG
ncbi:hypothetical protein ABTX77_26520 [Streptomyces sp. NPDC097704]|uniref:hypothetical protein n=1 Tax=Streptomyces sp. NPDC097704 TaxID=3157101 RepID=UPI0033340F41